MSRETRELEPLAELHDSSYESKWHLAWHEMKYMYIGVLVMEKTSYWHAAFWTVCILACWYWECRQND